jgi:hypothetical protein
MTKNQANQNYSSVTWHCGSINVRVYKEEAEIEADYTYHSLCFMPYCDQIAPSMPPTAPNAYSPTEKMVRMQP